MDSVAAFLSRCVSPAAGPMNRIDYLLAIVLMWSVHMLLNALAFGHIIPTEDDLFRIPLWYIPVLVMSFWVGFCTTKNRLADCGLTRRSTLAYFLLPGLLTVGMDVGPLFYAIMAMPLVGLLLWPGRSPVAAGPVIRF